MNPTPPPCLPPPPPTLLPACPPGVHGDADEVRHSLLHNPRRNRPHDETYLGHRPDDSAGSSVQTALGRGATDPRDGGVFAGFHAACCCLRVVELLSSLPGAAPSARVALIETPSACFFQGACRLVCRLEVSVFLLALVLVLYLRRSTILVIQCFLIMLVT